MKIQPNNEMAFRKASAKLRLAQFDFFGYSFCENCSRTTKELDVHHIIYRSEKPNHPHIHHENNLILVCRPCHNKFHNKKSYRNELVAKRSLNVLFGDDVLDK